MVSVALEFARTVEEVAAALARGPRLVLVDLTGGFEYERIFATLEGGLPGEGKVPVLAFTTHALARQTQVWHARCDRVVTKETLTQELPALLEHGITR